MRYCFFDSFVRKDDVSYEKCKLDKVGYIINEKFYKKYRICGMETMIAKYLY